MTWWKRSVQPATDVPGPLPLIRLDGISKVFNGDAEERGAPRSTASRSTSIAASTFRCRDHRAAANRRFSRFSALLDAPTSGRYWFNGRAHGHASPAEKARIRNVDIGLIFQSFNLIGDMTVYENVEYPLTLRGVDAADRAGARRCRARPRRARRARQAAPGLAVRRPSAARRHRARHRGPAADRAGRRADRQPRLDQRRGGDADARGTARRRRHDLPRDPRPALHRAANRHIYLFDGRVVEKPEV